MALRRGDSRSAARLAHRLKGSCLSIGASGLAASCEAVEAACEAGVPPGVETYHELRLCFDATTNALHEFLGGLPG
jgi:HPt (histidine-containing phosphotransfer) domain-containing protein